MKRVLVLVFSSFFLILFLLFFLLNTNFVNAQNTDCNNPSSLDLDKINICLDELNRAKEQSEKATKPLEDQLKAIQDRVKFIENDLVVKEKNIEEGYKKLEKQQQILARTIRDYYIKSYYNSPFLILLTANTASELTQILGYQRATADRDKTIILNIAIAVTGLEERKRDLESEKKEIVLVKEKLDKIVGEAKTYQATLSGKIAQLSQRQQEILAQRLAALNIPRSAGTGARGCSSDIGKDPGFSGSKFGFFTYGVPNRVGLNQYGAWGRAKAGQGYEQILRAYYNFDSIERKDATINVDGNGSYSLDEYTKRIYEVPDSWADNDLATLKAQAIAARSYALAYTNNGQGSICTTEQCQVFKPEPKGGNWEQAVNATSGLVMVQGGAAIKAWFSSTHGGYVFNSGDIGWSGTTFTKNAVDTTSGSVGGFSDVKDNAYDKDSPWFYCDWGSRSQYNGTAWLKSEEVADIVNVLLLAQKDSSLSNHLYQTDKPNPAGTETWSADRVRQELGSSAYNNISDVSVSADFGSGRSTTVTVSGDGKSNSFPADIFVTYFDLRAPATIYIPQLGKNSNGSLKAPLFNVER
ncbi:MAG: hypothetical protein A2W22_05775 [Candidatus Levybacteria bacterium RBG_16_35_11]|nr:MAG: hypothetical protein A2W22_05775 [Candidatus Levybacteria bacterium RBG_16_35_11]